MQVAVLAKKEKNSSHKGSDCTIEDSWSNLLKAAVYPILLLVEHWLNILMAHMDNVVNREANEHDQSYRLSDAKTPVEDLNRAHDSGNNQGNAQNAV